MTKKRLIQYPPPNKTISIWVAISLPLLIACVDHVYWAAVSYSGRKSSSQVHQRCPEGHQLPSPLPGRPLHFLLPQQSTEYAKTPPPTPETLPSNCCCYKNRNIRHSVVSTGLPSCKCRITHSSLQAPFHSTWPHGFLIRISCTASPLYSTCQSKRLSKFN